MVGQTDIKQALAQFQDAFSAVLTVAFVDLSSCMVLAASSKKPQAQEFLDELAQEATRLLDNPAARALCTSLFAKATPGECWQSDSRGTRLLLGGRNPDEALVFVVARTADRASIVHAARRLGQQIWGE